MAAEDKATVDRAAERASQRGSQSNPENVPEVVRYDRDELKENAGSLLRVSPHAVEGALAGSSKKTFTLDEAKKLVDAFLKRPEEGADA